MQFSNKHTAKNLSITTPMFLLLVYGGYYNIFQYRGAIFR